jgi:hypothetical protein
MDTKERVIAFRILPRIPDEPTFITVKVGSILMIDNLKSKGVRFLVSISDEELQDEITKSNSTLVDEFI